MASQGREINNIRLSFWQKCRRQLFVLNLTRFQASRRVFDVLCKQPLLVVIADLSWRVRIKSYSDSAFGLIFMWETNLGWLAVINGWSQRLTTSLYHHLVFSFYCDRIDWSFGRHIAPDQWTSGQDERGWQNGSGSTARAGRSENGSQCRECRDETALNQPFAATATTGRGGSRQWRHGSVCRRK